MIGEKLQGKDLRNGGEERVGHGDEEHVVRLGEHTAVALVHHGEDLGPARLDFLDVGHRLVEQFLVARERNDETAWIDERDGAVLELSGGIRLGVDIGDLLELERGFKRDGVVDVAPDEEERAVAAVALGKIADLRVQVNAALRALGQVRNAGDELGVPRRGERPALVGHPYGEQIEHGNLRGVAQVYMT